MSPWGKQIGGGGGGGAEIDIEIEIDISLKSEMSILRELSL